MAKKKNNGRRTSMGKVREIIRLAEECGLSQRGIARAVNVSRPVVAQYLLDFGATGLKYEEIAGMPDDKLLEIFSNKKPLSSIPRYQTLAELFPALGKKLKQKGQTLYNLWQEYIAGHPDGYAYSQFCFHYQVWREADSVTMHINYKAGDKMLVDFTGQKLEVIDPTTGKPQPVEVFVAILGASQYTYAEAVESQAKEDWIKANRDALKYFGGVPRAIVPDCLKSAVVKADHYEPDINPEYADFARHYGTVILPARAGHSKDKALAENAVKIAYSCLFVPLRKRKFYSLGELNEAIVDLLDRHNGMRFQRLKVSRRQLFTEIEEKELKPLPKEDYEPKKFLKLKVQFNYHVYLSEDAHYYSVPYRYVGKKVMVIYTSTRIEAFYGNIRIAFHRRDRRPGGYTTIPEHMPSKHRYYAQATPEKILSWSQKAGEGTQAFVRLLLEHKPHPEQAYRSCLGVLGLAKRYGYERVEAACRRAIQFKHYSYRAVKNILKNGLDKVEEESPLLAKLPVHENLRGYQYYD